MKTIKRFDVQEIVYTETKLTEITCDYCGTVHTFEKPAKKSDMPGGWISCDMYNVLSNEPVSYDFCSVQCLKSSLDCGKESPFKSLSDCRLSISF